MAGAGDALPYYQALYGLLIARAGRPEEGENLVKGSIARIDLLGDRPHEAEISRILGEIQLIYRADATVAAEQMFRRAIAVAKSQHAKSWELRAATSLARLKGEQGERQKAHDLLAPVYDWFTEGFDTPDLKDAKALLDELK